MMKRMIDENQAVVIRLFDNTMPTKATTAGGSNCFVNGEHDSLETIYNQVQTAFIQKRPITIIDKNGEVWHSIKLELITEQTKWYQPMKAVTFERVDFKITYRSKIEFSYETLSNGKRGYGAICVLYNTAELAQKGSEKGLYLHQLKFVQNDDVFYITLPSSSSVSIAAQAGQFLLITKINNLSVSGYNTTKNLTIVAVSVNTIFLVLTYSDGSTYQFTTPLLSMTAESDSVSGNLNA